MSAWSNVRSWLRDRPAGRASRRPTCRPTLELLEDRNPPGDLLGALTAAGATLTAPSWASGDLTADAVNSTAAGAGAAVIAQSSTTTAGTPADGGANAPSHGAASSPAASATGSSAPAQTSDSSDILNQMVLSPQSWANNGAPPRHIHPPVNPLHFVPIAEPRDRSLGAHPAIVPDLSPPSSPPVIPLNGNTWSLIGPAPETNGQISGAGNVSGRVAGLAPDPTNANIIYMAAAGGGVWKTVDGGATWTALTDGQATMFMGAIAVAPSSPTTIYAGTGEATNSGLSFYGFGVLKSTDGGASWTLETDNGAFTRSTIAKIAVSPTDPNTVYVAVSNEGVNGDPNVVTGIYKSTDGGATWINSTAGIAGVAITDQFSDVVIDPTNANNVYCAIGSDLGSARDGVYKSTDAGGTWAAAGNFTTLDNGDGLGVIKMTISASNASELIASVEDPVTSGLDFVGKTTDAGTTWSAVSPTVNYMGGQGWYDQAIAIDPNNANTFYVAGAFNGTDGNGNFINQALESTDAGANWTDITIGADGNGLHPDHHAMAFDANGKLLDGNDGGVWRLENSAVASIQWSDLNSNLATLQIIGLGTTPADPNTAYIGTQDNGRSKFSGSLAWPNVRFGDGGFTFTSPTDPTLVYGTFTGDTAGFIERSNDGGATWTDISAGINSSGTEPSDFYCTYVMDANNGSHLVLGTDHVYETKDQGNTWTVIGTPGSNGFTPAAGATIDAIGISPSSPGTIYVADSSANIFVTTNDGGSWKQINIPAVTDHIMSLVVDPANSQSVYAVRDRFGAGKVFHSTDGGTSWTDVSGNLPDLPAYSLAVNGNTGAIYLGNDNGVWSSTNGGASWAPFGIGMPNVEARQLYFDPVNSILAAGTHGRSVWEISTIPGGGGGGGGGGFGQEPEPNQTSTIATDFGTFTSGEMTTVSNVGIVPLPDGQNDYDWYRWEIGQDGVFSATEQTTAGSNLELHLFTLEGNTLVELASAVTPGIASSTLTTAVSAGQVILVEVKGENTSFGVMTQGVYNLTVTLT